MINLLPKSIKDEREYGRKNRTLVGFCFALFITAALVAAIMIGSIQFVGKEAENLNQVIEENEVQILLLEKDVKDLRDVSVRLKSADSLYEQNIIFSELIPQIASLLPQGTIINGLSLTGGINDPLSLNVSLLSADLVPVLQRNLTDSELFEAADINTISANNNVGSAYSFAADVNVSFTGSAEAKQKEKAAAAAQAAAAAEAAEAETVE